MPILYHAGGLSSPTRVLHGTTNAITHLVCSLNYAMSNELLNNIMCRLDDIFVYPKDPEEFVCSIENALRVWEGIQSQTAP